MVVSCLSQTQNRWGAMMNKDELVIRLKDIVAQQYEKDEADREWYSEIGALIDEIEATDEPIT